MSIFSWADSRIKRFNIWDIGALKFVLLIFGLIVGAYFPEWVRCNQWWLIALAVILYVYLLFRLFRPTAPN